MTEAGGETLVYDLSSHHIHHLNSTTAGVWHACDGQRTVDGIAMARGMLTETVQVALIQLAHALLLDGPLDPAVRAAGQSRRRFLKRAVVAGAVAAPALVSITAPHAAAADSGRPAVLSRVVATPTAKGMTGSAVAASAPTRPHFGLSVHSATRPRQAGCSHG